MLYSKMLRDAKDEVIDLIADDTTSWSIDAVMNYYNEPRSTIPANIRHMFVHYQLQLFTILECAENKGIEAEIAIVRAELVKDVAFLLECDSITDLELADMQA